MNHSATTTLNKYILLYWMEKEAITMVPMMMWSNIMPEFPHKSKRNFVIFLVIML